MVWELEGPWPMLFIIALDEMYRNNSRREGMPLVWVTEE